MPRAFLITNKRYNSTVDYEEQQQSRESSPERGVSTAEGLPFRCSDSETDSIGFESRWKPTSPHSPAHEARSLQGSPTIEEKTLPLTTYRVHDQVTPPPTPYISPSISPSSSPPSTNSYFRPASQNTATALVTVIRQLMQQQPQSLTVRHQVTAQQQQQADSHVCGECGKRYSTSSNLARHRQTHRSVTDKKARKCPHCDKVYVSVPAYSMHVRTHAQGCACPYCGKRFSRPWLLQGHIRTHTGEKPFACPVCRKAFADKSNLRAHVQTHSSSKPHVCRRCGKAFALKSYLYKHEESSCMRLAHRQQQQQEALDLQAKGPQVLMERNAAPLIMG